MKVGACHYFEIVTYTGIDKFQFEFFLGRRGKGRG